MIRIKRIADNSKLLSYFAVVFILLFSGSGLQVIETRLCSYILIAVTAYLLFRFFTQKRVPVFFFIPALIICGIFCTMLVTGDFAKFDSYIVLFCVIISGYILSSCKFQRQIFSAYSDVMFLIAIVGILGYVLVNTGIGLPFERVQMGDSGLYKYHTIYIFNYMEGLPERNCGAFWEPGIFASHLVLAMQYEIFSGRKNVLRLLVGIIAVVTCNSSAGFFLLVIVFAELFITSNNKEKYKGVKSVIGAVALLALFVLVLNIDTVIHYLHLEENQYIKKLLSDNLKKSTRYLSLTYNWEMFLKQPIFGNGLTEAISNVPIKRLTPDTTTSLFMLNAFGLIGVSFTLLAVKGTMGLRFMAWYERLLLLGAVIIIFNKETQYIMMSAWFLIFNFSFSRQWKRKTLASEEDGRAQCSQN